MRCNSKTRAGKCGPSPDERGATAVEYALLVALIALVVIAGVSALGQATLGLFKSAQVYPFGP